MATDGADFGRSKVCYGKAYTALRQGADDQDVAEIVVRGIEREIKWEKGAPAFCPGVDLLVIASTQPFEVGSHFLIREADKLSRHYADSAPSRRILDAVVKVGLEAMNQSMQLSRSAAAEQILAHLAKSRCEAMSGYATKHRTNSIADTQVLIQSITQKTRTLTSFHDLAARMLNPSATGLPAKAAKAAKIEHSISALNSISLEAPL